MERRRSRPEKYDRDLVHSTVKAMEKIAEVRRSFPFALLQLPACARARCLACAGMRRRPPCMHAWARAALLVRAMGRRSLLPSACPLA